MHGNKSQSQRERALARFEAGDVDTLVATDVASRGIDVPDVTHVINFDVPEDRDAYVHRVGRTGRAGSHGAGVSFVLADQVRDMRRIAADLGLSKEFESATGGSGGARRARLPAARAIGLASPAAILPPAPLAIGLALRARAARRLERLPPASPNAAAVA